MIFGVPPTDPLTFVLVPAVLVLVAVTASWIPARSAANADPCEVLRK
jgi:ABC-type lipoprotein release transport system permease subunit